MKRLNLAALQKAFLKEVNRIEKSLSKDLIYKDIGKLVTDHTENLQENYEEITGQKLEEKEEEVEVIKESD